MPPSPSRLLSEVATAERPAETRVVMRRAVVLGGSIAGLMAARGRRATASSVDIDQPA